MSLTPVSVTSTPAAPSLQNVDCNTMWKRYEMLKYNDVSKNALIEELIIRYQDLLDKHNGHSPNDGNNDALTQSLQREAELIANVKQLHRIMNRTPFILILLDLHDMMFHENFIRDGEEGGKRAAVFLQTAASTWAAANVTECPSDIKVVVRAYASTDKLAAACFKAGIVTSTTVVKEFTNGLMSGHSLFDYVDVGSDNGRVATKLCDMFELHAYDYLCRQILFGVTQDVKYAKLLARYGSDQEVLARVTLLQGPSMGPYLEMSPYGKKDFTGLFSRSALPPSSTDKRRDSHALNAASQPFTPGRTTPIHDPQVTTPQRSVRMLAAATSKPRADSSLSEASSDNGGVKTWAGLAKTAVGLPFTDLPRPAAPPAAVAQIRRNKNGQRLDEALEYDHDEVHRLKKLKLCNQHYIGQGCCHYIAGKMDKCPHQHDIKLNSKAMYFLRVVARETPCKRGFDCDDVKCIYGHCCPFPAANEGSMRGIGCLNGEGCRFPKAMHGMDKVAVKMTKVTGSF